MAPRATTTIVLACAAAAAALDNTEMVLDAAGVTTTSFPTHCDPRRNVVKNYGSDGAASILAAHNTTCRPGAKNFDGEVLLYLTPWNRGGYDIARKFGAKFTYVSPVWLQMRDSNGQREDGNKMEITGTQDVDVQWMADVRAACGGKCAIMPRVVWEARNWDVAGSIEAITSVVRDHGFDGVVLEAHLNPITTKMFMPELVKALRLLPEAQEGMGHPKVVMVVPPDGLMKPEVFAKLADAGVHRFSVMTYDHSARKGTAGPNAPIDWVASMMAALIPANLPDDRAAELRKKALLGVPFYGYDNRQVILGPRYLELLREHNPRIKLNADAREHHFMYHEGDIKHTVYYPTPLFVNARLHAAEEYAGVAIWEAGQGLPYFMDLL